MKQDFIRLTKQRSIENTESILSLLSKDLYGNAISILRQELDSLIRVCYLLQINDLTIRHLVIQNFLQVHKIIMNGKAITDRDMVTKASRYNHWAPEVYDFGCHFIHLSIYHDYKKNDPLIKLDPVKKQLIKGYLHSYHQFPDNVDITFPNVTPYLPKIAEKVSNNLISYLKDLENDRVI